MAQLTAWRQRRELSRPPSRADYVLNDHFLDIDAPLGYMWVSAHRLRHRARPPCQAKPVAFVETALPFGSSFGESGRTMASILIVDDEASIRSLLRKILEEDGHQIREASNGEVGLTLYREAPADLVITDILMPERDGMEVTLALTREFLDAKVIAMTGATGDQNFLNVAKLFGARRVIKKPFSVEAIRRLVRYTLDH